MSIRENVERLLEKVRQIASSRGEPRQDVRIVLVTKTVPPERIREAFDAGVWDFGENRVQELLKKKKELSNDIAWHMIGHLQANKVKEIIGQVALIHSLDRMDLLKEIEKQAESRKISSVPCLIQVNVSGGQDKFGFKPDEVEDFAAAIQSDSPVSIRGLMAIGPLTEDEQKIRMAFRSVKKLQEILQRKFPGRDWGILSMGMSGDYPLAIEEGANLIRIGTAVFGERPKP